MDILEGKQAQPFSQWLRDHPGVEILTRDRSEAYALGGRTGAPSASATQPSVTEQKGANVATKAGAPFCEGEKVGEWGRVPAISCRLALAGVVMFSTRLSL